jgi:hypothetical protein
MTYRINDNGTDRDMTPAEIAAYEASQQSIDDAEAERLAAAQATATAKTSARTKLKALGLTDAEIAALVG